MQDTEQLGNNSFRSPYLEALEEGVDTLPDGEIKEVYDRLKSKLELLENEGACTFTREEADRVCVPVLDLWSEFGVLSREPPHDLLQKAFAEGKMDLVEWCGEYGKKKGGVGLVFRKITPLNLFQDNPDLLPLLSESEIHTSDFMCMLATRGLRKCFNSLLLDSEWRYNPVYFSNDTMWKGVCEDAKPHKSYILSGLKMGHISVNSNVIDFLVEYFNSIPGVRFQDVKDTLEAIPGHIMSTDDIITAMCKLCSSKGYVTLLEILYKTLPPYSYCSSFHNFLLASAALKKHIGVCEYIRTIMGDTDTYNMIAMITGFLDIISPATMRKDETVCAAMVYSSDLATKVLESRNVPLLKVLESIPHIGFFNLWGHNAYFEIGNSVLENPNPAPLEQTYILKKIFLYVLERDPDIVTRPRYPDLGALYKSLLWIKTSRFQVSRKEVSPEEFHIFLVSELSRRTTPEFMYSLLCYVRGLGLTGIEKIIRESFNQRVVPMS